jgi:hypothetical protein
MNGIASAPIGLDPITAPLGMLEGLFRVLTFDCDAVCRAIRRR